MPLKLDNLVGLSVCDKQTQSVLTVLRQGDFYIGRAPDNDLVIDNPTISSKHARIYTYLTVSYIEDLKSTNGTYVNGKRIQKHILKAGDAVSLGKYELLLADQQSEQAKLPIAGAAGH